MTRLKNKKQKTLTGFTLIELLVVIAIIGLLATVVMVSLNNARIKARNAQRTANINQMQKALELYNNENGYYPKADGGASMYGYWYSDWGSHCGGNWCTLETALTQYLKPIPRDPNGETQLSYYYYYRTHGNGASYGLAAMLEGSNATAVNDGGCENGHYEIGPSLARCGCSPQTWRHQGTDLCP